MSDREENKKNFDALCENIKRLTKIPLFLIVEDYHPDSVLLSHELETFCPKCQILTCKSGEESLSIVESQDIDAMFLDLKLEGLDGLQVMLRLKQIQNKKPVLIIVTGLPEDSPLALQAIQFGAVNIIAKPVTQEDLKNVFQTI